MLLRDDAETGKKILIRVISLCLKTDNNEGCICLQKSYHSNGLLPFHVHNSQTA